MIEKIGQEGFETISEPCKELLDLVEVMKTEKESISVCEVGVGIGATAVEVIKRLEEKDQYYMFGFDTAVEELTRDLKKCEFCRADIIPMGNTNRLYDSYSWPLAMLLIKMKEKNKGEGIFDLVYLDGAHSFFHDGLACCILKQLIKKNGILVLDDVYWSYDKSPTQNPKKRPEILQQYSMQTIETAQVKMVMDCFLEGDPNWKRLSDIKSWRAVYEKTD